MQNLMSGYQRFHAEIYPQNRELFRSLDQGQAPETLIVSCSDSRVDLNLVTHARPGDIFHVRNAGNLVPPPTKAEYSVAATIEYAVVNLPVHDLVVCGHSDCGAVKAVKAGVHQGTDGNIARWLRIAAEQQADLATLSLDELIGANVSRQLENLRDYPFIAERVDAGNLKLWGWVYEIGSSRILQLDESTGDFLPLDTSNTTIEVS